MTSVSIPVYNKKNHTVSYFLINFYTPLASRLSQRSPFFCPFGQINRIKQRFRNVKNILKNKILCHWTIIIVQLNLYFRLLIWLMDWLIDWLIRFNFNFRILVDDGILDDNVENIDDFEYFKPNSLSLSL